MAVYVAARDLAGFFLGTHQFIIIEPTDPSDYAVLGNNVLKDLGDGTNGIVVGAQNRGDLVAEFFEASDYQATREHYNPGKYTSWYASDFDTEVHKVDPNGQTESALAKRVCMLINNYMVNGTHLRLKYPTAGMGINSNSWAQTVVQLAGGTVTEDFFGLDVSHNRRVPAIMFAHPFG